MELTSFPSNIIALYGDKGKDWLLNLPKIIDKFTQKWQLTQLKPEKNLTYHYVASGFKNNQPIILKLGFDATEINRENLALRAFDGFGTVKVLALENGAILLERAMPGISLKSYFPLKEEESIYIAAQAIKTLHRIPPPASNSSFYHSFPHISDWLKVLDQNSAIPNSFLQQARHLRDNLLQTSMPSILLHGDCHHDNILQNNDEWLVIDPKGVMGESCYELAAFIRNPIPELLTEKDAPKIIQNRIRLFAKLFDFDPKRIKDWCYVQAVLSWIWTIEDGVDTDYFKRIASIFNDQLNI